MLDLGVVRAICAVVVLLAAVSSSVAAGCTPRDFLAMPLEPPSQDPQISAVLLAYPDITYDAARAELASPSEGRSLVVTKATDAPPEKMLTAPSFYDQFRYVYPLSYDLSSRLAPWVDPGRLRNADFMAFLYFANKAATRDSLVDVVHPGSGARFSVTDKHGVSCQLAAALGQIGDRYPDVFNNLGGSFNWRVISGTDRLSVHSYGAAVDLNTELGGYWVWSGAKPGHVDAYQSGIPREVVAAFERFGFIWGGKWHHFDGMHFEFRPELIVYARLVE